MKIYELLDLFPMEQPVRIDDVEGCAHFHQIARLGDQEIHACRVEAGRLWIITSEYAFGKAAEDEGFFDHFERSCE